MSVFKETHEPFSAPTQGDELLSNDTTAQTRSRLAASAAPHSRAQRVVSPARKPKSGNKSKASLETIMEVSRQLNALEDARAEEARQQRLRVEAEEQRVRAQRWEEIKGRMKARQTPLPSARSTDWGDEADEADEGTSNATSTLLATRDADGRIVSRKRWAVITWYQKLWYAVYNFVQYFTLAASFAPGVLYKANDPDMYYRREVYED